MDGESGRAEPAVSLHREEASAGVHARVRFTIVSQDERHCRYRQEITLLGMRQADDLLNTWLPDGSLHSEAFEEDRRDLESGAYARYRARTADAA